MILDADGKHIGGNVLVTPEWLVRDLKAQMECDAAKRRMMALRHSVDALLSVEGPRIGATIHVRRPRRYQP